MREPTSKRRTKKPSKKPLDDDNRSVVSLNVLDVQTVAQTYKLTDAQCRTYDAFANLLAEFDTTMMLDMLEDVLHDAQHRTRLQDYLGVNTVTTAQLTSSLASTGMTSNSSN
ncbi:hypothetical protein H257_13905 [Aphanomyces astaci]|uniref:Uncharacterized protein n=1 Tax=Aphanomyces astaci TaxID=112090 RepID=W4FU72_APHAT|nr:hypothetical protein H257_13905 [Aphanomyces astaci]ETV70511.1 hypothetical protein H257_13905 [Aphanomyces astaci]|eukprot:XP_009839894.1 hypothetical protein H257_13905 [Aphanomyces astaci]